MKKILLLSSIILLSGCGDKTPKCTDEATIQTVMELAKTKSYAIKHILSTNMISDVEVTDIRTQEVDNGNHTSTCAANLVTIVTDQKYNSLTYPITYTTQLTDDGKNTYINVIGLPR